MTTISGIPKAKLTSLLFYVVTFLRSFLLSYHFFIIYLTVSLYYLLKLLSFISHVFIAASILLIAILLSLTNNISSECSKNDLGFLLNASHVVLEKFIPRIDRGDEESYPLEALDLYKFVFETYMIDETDNNVENSEDHPEEKILQAVESSILKISQNNQEECAKSKDGILTSSSKEDSIDDGQLGKTKSAVKEKRFEEFLKEVDEFEFMDCGEVGKSLDKDKKETNMAKTESIKKRHSRRQSVRTRIDFSEDGGGRMSRKEKDWKKSLTCKLFEEKPSNNVEDMDLLWETYEEKISKRNSRSDEMMNNENDGLERKIIVEDFEDEEEIDVHVSCLHAFKFSGGKMNTGVGGRNLVRISKVVKGIRWLRSVTKHGRKLSI